MKKGKGSRSTSSFAQLPEIYNPVVVPQLDDLRVDIMSLRITDCSDKRRYFVKVTFFDQLIISTLIKPIWVRDQNEEMCIARGIMSYDPSDYEKMCLFADTPLTVQVQPFTHSESRSYHSTSDMETGTPNTEDTYKEISCCNIDIMPIFIDQDKLFLRTRLQPLIKPRLREQKSWDNLPLLTMRLMVKRNTANVIHHVLLRKANFMKITLVAAYNLIIPFDGQYTYTAATVTPLHNEQKIGLMTYNQGRPQSNRFRGNSFYPKWESLNTGDIVFSEHDEKFECNLDSFVNNGLDLKNYVGDDRDDTTVWGSFHRTLLLPDSVQWFSERIKQHKWPFEVHLYGEQAGYSFMAFLDLFNLLYPGEDTIHLAVPLIWVNENEMMEACGSALLLAPNEKLPSSPVSYVMKENTKSTSHTSGVDSSGEYIRPTGGDDGNAFIIVEVKLGKALTQPVIPKTIADNEISTMLKDLERNPVNRKCLGRGQLDRDWINTVQQAVNSLRRVPCYAIPDICSLNRQLSETRTRVEIFTSFWLEAAININNNFVISNFVDSDNVYEELLQLAHVHLMKITSEVLINADNDDKLHPVLRAARHARQMQDTSHAVNLFAQVANEQKSNPNVWREFGTCLLDVDKDLAAVCLKKSMMLNPRHPLTLISMGCIAFDEDPETAEPFFTALLALYPFLITGWFVASAYFIQRQQFYLVEKIIFYIKKTLQDGMGQYYYAPRSWQHELGDWWDSAQIMPGMNQYYDAADLLLRLRCLTLADVCIATALSESGESAVYFHMVALSCRLRGDYKNALCHLRTGIEKSGEVSYLRALEAECLHKLGDVDLAMRTFGKSGSCMGAYSILLSTPCRDPQRVKPILVDLVRRQPSAYAWLNLADNWLQGPVTRTTSMRSLHDDSTPALTCAIACVVQALKIDRRAGRGWAMLAKLVKPKARRKYCRNMALICGYDLTPEKPSSEQSICYEVGKPLLECKCHMCRSFKVC